MTTTIRRLLHFIIRDYYFDFSLWWFFFRLTPPPHDDRPRLLIIDHVFDQDIEALNRANHTFSFIIMSAFHLRNIATLLFPPTVESYHAYNDPAMAPLKCRWRAVMNRFVRRLIARYHIQAVIAPSDNFFYVRELVPALHDQHIPFYVIDKEGTICPAYFVHFAQYIRDNCPLLADHILVWSERQKQFWVKTGVGADRITITGQPRSDFWRQPDRWLSKQQLGITGLRTDAPLVLFFTYDPWAYTPDYMVAKGEMHWDVLRSETHQALFQFVKKHPETDIVIKAHPQQLDKAELLAEIAAAGTTNVHLSTGSAISNHLIVNADCIIGFQTTALIEAMLTDKPILYTFWGEAKDRWSQDLIPFHETRSVQTVTSPKELIEQLDDKLLHSAITPAVRSARDAFVAEYFTNVDGHSSERALHTLSALLRLPS